MAKTVQVAQGDRLVYYREAADQAYWDKVWDDFGITPELYASVEAHGTLPYFEHLYKTYFLAGGRLLEAGCGTGTMVVALRRLGFDAEGIEYAEETVKQVNAVVPDLPVKLGDVLNIDVPDGHYDGYLSFGVVEHRQAGPEPYLEEAWRVLKTGGIMMISVPFYNGLRKMKSRLSRYEKQAPDGLDFYQYAYSVKTFTAHLEAAGFEVVTYAGYDAYKCLKDELPIMRRVYKLPKLGWRLERWVKNGRHLDARFGHMLMVTCRKV